MPKAKRKRAPGGGRKPEPDSKKMISKRVAMDVYEYLREQTNATTTLENAVRATKDFKQWAKETKGS